MVNVPSVLTNGAGFLPPVADEEGDDRVLLVSELGASPNL